MCIYTEVYRCTRSCMVKNEFYVICITLWGGMIFDILKLRFTELSDYSKVKELVPPHLLTSQPCYKGQWGWHGTARALTDVLAPNEQHTLILKTVQISTWVHSAMWSVMFLVFSLPLSSVHLQELYSSCTLQPPAHLLTAFLLKKKIKPWILSKIELTGNTNT